MNIPQQLLDDLQAVKGFDESSFLQAHEVAAVTSVRLHPLKRSPAFAGDEAVPWCPSGRYLNERPVFTLDPLYHAGAYYVQEASSMFLDHVIRSLLPDRNNIRVLDLCAAPGGKSTLLASLLGQDSLLLSNEVIRTRASILEENMTRWGYMNTWVTSNDARDLGKLHGYFDIVVVDAPCSGSGLFRKDAHALDEWSEANVQLCSERQQRILADIWPAVKENGLVIYATCSYSSQEDEAILKWLALEFAVTGMQVPLQKEWGIVEVEASGLFGYRFFPHKVSGEGFFLAAIRKTEETPVLNAQKFKSTADKKAHQQASYLLDTDGWICVQDKEGYNAITPSHEADWHQLSKRVYLRKTGLALGAPSAKDWLPSHDVALSVNRNLSLPALELNKEQALHFLKKDDIHVATTMKGWHIVTYNGLGLGWVKALGNRFNNYLPKHWRIRMDIPDEDKA